MEALHELFGDGAPPRSKTKAPRETKKKWRRRQSKELQSGVTGPAVSSQHVTHGLRRPSPGPCGLMAQPDGDEVESNGVEDQSSMVTALPPEPAMGNVEYKLKLVNPTRQRFEHLVTQMKWRLREGEGEAIYEIGVEDNGFLAGLSEADMEASMETLRSMAAQLGATAKVLRRRQRKMPSNVNSNQPEVRHSAEVLVRKIPDDRTSIELRIAVLGNADVGKSTLLGVLTQGELDNGRGRARLIMFRHLHEVQTGRTSSISHEIMGFDSEGQIVNYNRCQTAEEMVETSAKLITFIDLAGHYKYLHTTIFGLTGYCPHYIMLVVSANTGVAGTTLDHLSLVLALGVPFFIVVTKIDVTARAVVERTMKELEEVLTYLAKSKCYVVNEESVSKAARFIRAEGGNVVPIFLASAVTGKGLTCLTDFLHVLPPYLSNVERSELEKQPVNFQIDEIWNIPEVGAVVGGLLTKGVVTENMTLKLGPIGREGEFLPVTVKTIHRNKANCGVVRASQSASLGLYPLDDRPLPLRRGMVLLHPQQNACAAKFFLAKVMFFSCDGEDVILWKNAHATVHIGSVRQSAAIRGIFASPEQYRAFAIPSNEDGATEEITVMFEFLKGLEYVEPGYQVLFRHGHVKGRGKVTHTFYGDGLYSSTSGSSGASSGEDTVNGEEEEF